MEVTRETILVVDDEEGMRDVIRAILEDEGYRVLQAAGGRAALAMLETQRPSLILSDVMMPEIDGFALYTQVRAKSQWSQIPFIFLTARDGMIDLRHGMGLGADDYLLKPFDQETLLAAVKVRLARAATAEAAVYAGTRALRDTILQTLSHELRTPMLFLMGYGELLEESAQRLEDEEFLGLLRGLRTGSERLLHLVESALLFSKLESGALQSQEGLEVQTFQPDSLVADTVKDFQSLAAARLVSLALHQGAAGAIIAADPRFFVEIVRRLVDNAIKFSKAEGGGVILRTRTDHGHWVLDIVDRGVGIRPDVLSHIFQAFRQVDREKMEQQGAGLGLAIVNGLVRVHGGQVDVESEPDRGSTFTVRLPLVTVGSKLSIQDSSAEGKGVRREAVILQTISQRASPSPRPGVDA